MRFLNLIFAKTKKFAKPLPVYKGQGSNLLSKKIMVENLMTLSFSIKKVKRIVKGDFPILDLVKIDCLYGAH